MPPAAAALALALCDFESPVWLDDALAGDPAVHEFLRFHTGAPIVADAGRRHFAFVARTGRTCRRSSASRSARRNIPTARRRSWSPVEDLAGEGGWRLTGPGRRGRRPLQRRARCRPTFVAQLADNRALFPRGVDLIFACGDRLAALPRSTLVEA